MITQIDEAKKCLTYVREYRQNIIFMRELILQSNECVEEFNNTHEGHAFNFILNTLHARMVVDLRKILEPSTGDKNNNIDSLVKFIRNNKEMLAQKHYDDFHNTPTQHFGSINPANNPETKDFFDNIKKKHARKEAKECSDKIDVTVKRWDKVWKLLGQKAFDIKTARTTIVHSTILDDGMMPSLNKIKKLLYIATYFIKNINFIIDNTCYDFKSEQKVCQEIAETFWKRIQ